jgi:prepilin-type N-terminal cleavage/methylation domain-containing protein
MNSFRSHLQQLDPISLILHNATLVMWAKHTHLSSQNTRRGFTIVELLIVIVVIGILAAITIVAYNGVQSRARFSKMQSDIRTLQNYIEAYNATNGSYPSTGGNWKYQRQDGNSFIPGLVPGITSSIPSITDGPTGGITNNTYVYNSNGTNYKLIRLYQPSLPADEWAQLPSTLKDGTWTDRWGVWTPGGASF